MKSTHWTFISSDQEFDGERILREATAAGARLLTVTRYDQTQLWIRGDLVADIDDLQERPGLTLSYQMDRMLGNPANPEIRKGALSSCHADPGVLSNTWYPARGIGGFAVTISHDPSCCFVDDELVEQHDALEAFAGRMRAALNARAVTTVRTLTV